MSKRLTAEELRTLARQKIGGMTQAGFAIANGISPQYLSDFLSGNREAGLSLQQALGVREVVMYEKVKP